MKNVRIKLKSACTLCSTSVATVVACFAVSVMLFSGCDPVTPNKPDDPDKPDKPGEPYSSVYKQLKEYPTIKNWLDVIPPGIYHFLNNNKESYVAVSTDGSYTFNAWDNGTITHFKDKIYIMFHQNNEWLRREYLNLNAYLDDYLDKYSEYGYEYRSLLTLGVADWLLFTFLRSEDCEKKPTSVIEEKVADVACKKYVYKPDEQNEAHREYWILRSGTCLKYKITYSSTDIEDYAVTKVETNVGDFNSNLSKLPPVPDGKALPTDFNSLKLSTYKKYGNEWLTDYYPRSVDKWVKKYSGPGTIDWCEVHWGHHQKFMQKYDYFTNFNVAFSGASVEDMKNYVNTVLSIEMMEGKYTDERPDNTVWKGNNGNIVKEPEIGNWDHYIIYEITYRKGILIIRMQMGATQFV